MQPLDCLQKVVNTSQGRKDHKNNKQTFQIYPEKFPTIMFFVLISNLALCSFLFPKLDSESKVHRRRKKIIRLTEKKGSKSIIFNKKLFPKNNQQAVENLFLEKGVRSCYHNKSTSFDFYLEI